MRLSCRCHPPLWRRDVRRRVAMPGPGHGLGARARARLWDRVRAGVKGLAVRLRYRCSSAPSTPSKAAASDARRREIEVRYGSMAASVAERMSSRHWPLEQPPRSSADPSSGGWRIREKQVSRMSGRSCSGNSIWTWRSAAADPSRRSPRICLVPIQDPEMRIDRNL